MATSKITKQTSKNQFRFRSFTEQIASIRIDVVHQISTISDTPNDKQTFFHESLLKWREINCSNSFDNFYTEVRDLVQSVPLLIHHKNEVFYKLKEHIEMKDPLEIEVLLDLLVQLARDLLVEFYPFFKDIFPLLISLCYTQNASLIERVFTCVAYLFKFLWRQMLHDITNIFQLYSQLLVSTERSYIRTFAVESIAFLFRKTHNYKGLCELLLTHVADDDELIDGVGLLMFEISRGVQHQFHSCVHKLLPVLFNSINGSRFIDSDNVLKSVCKMIELMCEYTRSEFSIPIWTSLLDCVETSLGSAGEGHCTGRLLHLVGIITSWRKGNRLISSITQRLHNIVLSVVGDPSLADKPHLSCVTFHLVTSVLLHHDPCDSSIKKIITEVFNRHDCFHHVTGLILELLSSRWQHFDKVILPHCVTFCELIAADDNSWDELMLFLTKFFNIYNKPLHLPISNDSSLMRMFRLLLDQQLSNHNEPRDISLLWSIARCLQYIKNVSSELVGYIRQCLSIGIDILSQDCDRCVALMFISQCIKCLCVIDDSLMDSMSFTIISDLLKANPTNLSLLQSSLCCFNAMRDINHSLLTQEQLIVLVSVLKCNLSHPSNLVRNVTLQILNIFPQPSSEGSSIDQEESAIPCSLLTDCLKAEDTPSNLADYRNKLIWLSKLKYSPHRFSSFPQHFKEIPLRYLLGVLYDNFSLLWGPVSDLISSYACGELKELFWSIFGEALSNVSILLDGPGVCQSVEDVPSTSVVNIFHNHVNSSKTSQDGSPDHVNYQQLLWKCMENFIKMSVSQSRLFIPFFFKFLKQEYRLTNEISLQDISIYKEDCPVDESDGDMNVTSKKRQSKVVKTLVCMMSLLSKCTNVKSMYHHGELKECYMKLLMERDVRIQRLALSCLMNYKDQSLLSYQEHLETLLNDKSIKEQLLLLGSSTDNSIVKPDHVQGLVPVLVRLLYGRMRGNGKTKVHSKKRSLIQSLASCGEDEIKEYINIATCRFHSFNHEGTCPNGILPLKIQLGFIHEMKELISVTASNQLEPHLSCIIPVILSLAKSCNQLLIHHREQINPKFINSLKTIRHSLFDVISELWSNFHYIDLSCYQNDLLTSLVWPQIINLPNECKEHPTPLLKMLQVWSHHKRLHYLFSSTYPNGMDVSNGDSSILHFIYQCLSSPGVSVDVSIVILELTLYLIGILKYDDNDGDGDGDGDEYVKPFIPSLLSCVRSVIKDKQQDGPLLEYSFQLLTWISNHVTEEIKSHSLVELLLPFMNNGTANRQKRDFEQILLCILNLIPTVSSVNTFYNSLAKLFGCLTSRKNRQILCDIFQTIADVKDNRLKETAEVLSMINSWDPNQIEEPHYEDRQEGFARGKQLVHSRDIAPFNWINIISPILHNSLFFIHQSDDISIRDGASSFISYIIQSITTEDVQPFQALISGIVVPSVKSGLRSKKESVMAEFVDILSQLVIRYSDHSQFADLVHLTHLDPEADFFKNVHHIQLHRRTKAFRRLASITSQMSFSQNSLSSYILPLVSHVVFSPLTSREHNMIQEAINVIGVISLKLKWNHYYNLLKHYLHQLSHQLDIHRNIIRTVVAILDNFHFEISVNNNEGMDECIMEVVDSSSDDIIHNAITTDILPRLESCLTVKSEMPHHRLSHKEDNCEADKLRVPIAMAMTKLLLCLPQPSIERHITSLLMKVCHSLKSRAQDIRDVARTTLLKMCKSLGPRYLSFTLKELKDSLTRGYQLHVLSYTIHHMIHGMIPLLRPGDLDSSSDDIKHILVRDLFDGPAEEREVDEFISKISEGKKCKSLHTYGMVVRFLSPSLIPEFLQPIKERLENQPVSKISLICEQVFKRVVHGIIANKMFTIQTLLMFTHGIINKTISQLQPKLISKASQDDANGGRPIDSRLLPPQPSRHKPPPVIQTNISSHVLTHFGLQLLESSLKKEKSKSSKNILEMLDPFVSLLSEAMTTPNVKVLSITLHCLIKLLKLPLPSLKVCVPQIVSHLFEVLKNYAFIGAVSSDTNQELVTIAFKCMTKIIEDFTYHHISDEELKLLLSYIEQDIHDYKRQSTAFPLLKAILSRNLSSTVIHDVMKKIAEVVINGDNNKVRSNSRHAVIQYMLSYNLKKKLTFYFDFFIANISYDVECGRESVLEMFNLFFNKFPIDVLEKNLTYFFVPLISQLLNDDSLLCRKMIAEILRVLLKKVGKEQRNKILSMIMNWFDHDKFINKELAAHALGIVVDVEEKSFTNRLTVFLPIICDSFHYNNDDDSMETNDVPDPAADHMTIALLSLLERIFSHCGIDNQHDEVFKVSCDIWNIIQSHLLHPHTWIRQISSNLFSMLFESVDAINIASVLSGIDCVSHKVCHHFLIDNGGLSKIQELQEVFVRQLKVPTISSDHAHQVIRNLVFIGTVVFNMMNCNISRKRKTVDHKEHPIRKKKKKSAAEVEVFHEHEIEKEPQDLLSPGEMFNKAIYQMDKLCRYEAGHHPKESLKRTCAFKWIGAMANVVVNGKDGTQDLLFKLLQPIQKVLQDKEKTAGEDLHKLAEEVVDLCGIKSHFL
jgi:U3 small nucleolar RNA-associated protein 20